MNSNEPSREILQQQSRLLSRLQSHGKGAIINEAAQSLCHLIKDSMKELKHVIKVKRDCKSQCTFYFYLLAFFGKLSLLSVPQCTLHGTNPSAQKTLTVFTS